MDRRDFAFGAAAALAVPALAHALPPPPLAGRRRAEQQAPARFLMVMLHGVGGNGGGILSQTGNLQSFAPSVAEVAPNAPVSMGPGAHSWLPVPDGGKRQPTFEECGSAVDRYCDLELARLNLAPDRLILFGFSQGAVMALNVGLRRTHAPVAIIAFSGPYLTADPLGPGKPAVLFVRGTNDDSINPRAEQDVVERLTAQSIPVESHVLSGLGHAIDQRGIDLAGALLRRVTA
jgi:phospholipase/carboxylesterase